MAKKPREVFCSSCGQSMAAGDGFCPSCGAGAGGPARAQAGRQGNVQAQDSERRTNPVAVAVFIAVLVAGAAMLIGVSQEPAQQRRAVPGSPSGSGERPPSSGELPPNHPLLELPAEARTLLDQLTVAANAAPEDIAIWQHLTEARFRASRLDRSYSAPAKEALSRLLELDPDNVEGVRMAGAMAFESQDFSQAQSHFEHFLELDPDDVLVLTDLGSALLFQEKAEAAVGYYRKAIETKPDFLQAHFNLGIALQQQGDSKGALEAYESARKLAPDPETKRRVDEAIAVARGRGGTGTMGMGLPPDHPPIGEDAVEEDPLPPGVIELPIDDSPPFEARAGKAAAAREVPSNASSDFQRAADAVVTGHRIAGAFVDSIDWQAATAGRVYFVDFPIKGMVEVLQNKFKSGLNEQLSERAGEHGADSEISIELVDKPTGRVMAVLDGKEWVGWFDEERYQ